VYKEIFIYPVLVATLLLIYHSYKIRGLKKTLQFWGLGYFILFIREAIYQNFMPVYRFYGVTLKILNVPFVIPMGWLFTCYISLFLAEQIMGINLNKYIATDSSIELILSKEYEQKVLPVIIFACLITTTICFAIENTAVNMQWWGDPYLEGMQTFMNSGWLGGWMVTCFWFLTLIIYIMYPSLRLKKNLILVLLIWCHYILGEPITIYQELWGSSIWFYFIYIFLILIVLIPALLVWKDFSFMYILMMGILVALKQILLLFTLDFVNQIVAFIFLGVALFFSLYIYRKYRPELPINIKKIL